MIRLALVFTLSLFFGAYVYGQGVDFTIHGYLTQGYGKANRYQYYGVPEQGTSDLRNLALQFRLEYKVKSRVIVQFNSRRLGKSPVGAFFDDVELDWGFYEYQHSGSLSLKVGKVQLPVGIYNEIRDVGTVLPFYRIPPNIYGEGTWTSETIDGLVTSKSWEASEWLFDLDVFFGGWDSIEFVDADSYSPRRIEDAFGFQIWITIPDEKWRFGIHAHQQSLFGGVRKVEGEKQEIWLGSLEGEYEHFIFRAEYAYYPFEPDPSHWDAYNIHLGFKFSEKWALNLLRDQGKLNVVVPNFANAGVTFDDDAVSLNYSFNPSLVLKGEYHLTEGYAVEGLAPNIYFDEPVKLNFFLLSLSASF